MIETAEIVAVTERELEELSAQGQRWELVRGELKQMTPTGGLHGAYTMNLSAYVTIWVQEHRLGRCFGAETGFRVAENPVTILAPDFAFIARDRVPNPIPTGFVPVVPDLILETRSPYDRSAEVAAKIALWLQVGVRLVWEFDPRRRILTVYEADHEPRELGMADTLEGGEVLPGWTLALHRILPD
jgi:Uma2 family endonuclease